MRRWLRFGAIGAGLVLLLVLVVALWGRGRIRGSLPVLDGTLRVAGIAAAATVERDANGVPTIRATSRADLAFATGFVHAQERFFQMDAMRRAAAGELAALLGPGLVEVDRQRRPHGFRTIARERLAASPTDTRRLFEAYADGVAAGLGALDAPPFEYLLLRSRPEPWLAEDGLLVLLAMYLDLQGDHWQRESDIGLVHELLPASLAAFLTPAGDEWDAPLFGPALETPPIPPAEDVDLRTRPPARSARHRETADPVHPGSNAWVVAGRLTADGGALLANDMHLGLGLPNVWFRAVLELDAPAPDGRRLVGVTLPGVPMLVSGSNGRVAWGFTNSYGDWADLVELEPADGDRGYRTPDGPRTIETVVETIEVRGAEPVALEVERTIWGPVIDRDHRDRRRALRWVAHDPEGVNAALRRLETADTLEAALEAANVSGIPAQNVMLAADDGRIGWTIAGPIPRRYGEAGSRPSSWADGRSGWSGYHEPERTPRIVDPPTGRLWTANNRVVDLERLALVGDGGYAPGARARQIRDGLASIERATPAAMLALQLDDRALFLERWRRLLIDVLESAPPDETGRRELLRSVLDERATRASVDSVGYRMVRAFRSFLVDAVFDPLTLPCVEADPRFRFRRIGRYEGPLWSLVEARPPHLLDPAHADWDALLLATADTVLDHFLDAPDARLDERTWGARNRTVVSHPLSRAVPALGRWLDMPAVELPGDTQMPRVQSPRFGASERLVVSPGLEAAGLFHMPGGQSGHPWSPYYGAGHDDWVTGAASPLLPTTTTYRLTLEP